MIDAGATLNLYTSVWIHAVGSVDFKLGGEINDNTIQPLPTQGPEFLRRLMQDLKYLRKVAQCYITQPMEHSNAINT